MHFLWYGTFGEFRWNFNLANQPLRYERLDILY